MQTALKLVHGDADPRLERAGLTRVVTFGNLREHSTDWLLALFRRCVTAGWVSFTGRERPVVVLTEDGRAVMKGLRPAHLLLPALPRVRGGARSPATRPKAPGLAVRAESREPDAGEGAIFDALRRHRLEVARAEGIAPFIVASDRTLRDIARLRPKSLDELQLAYGIGQHKIQRYGDGLLRAVALASAGAEESGRR